MSEMQPCDYCGELTSNGCVVVAVVACDRHFGADTRAFAEMQAALAAERARAEAAEGREARYRAALLVAERNTTDELIGHGSNLLRMCRVCDQVGEQGHIPHAPDCPFAALAGTPEGEPTLAPREAYPATIIVTEVRRGVPTIHPDEIAPRDGAFEGEQG